MGVRGSNNSFLPILIAFLILGVAVWWIWRAGQSRENVQLTDIGQIDEPKLDGNRLKKARSEYFVWLLRDPKTKRIPKNIRDRELEFARGLPINNEFRSKRTGEIQSVETIAWEEIGPNNVGGRTRALGVDVDNPNTIIAGGVSGGIWKSTDGGASWVSKSTATDRLSVSWLVQDTTSTGNDTWYYATGEWDNTVGVEGIGEFDGNGVFRSTDNGETWSHIPSTDDGGSTYDSPFDYISKLVVSPMTGTLFMASNGYGIYRFDEGTGTFISVLGSPGGQVYADVAVNKDGELLAVLSDPFDVVPAFGPGIYVSTDDGLNWVDKTPSTYPVVSSRSFAAFSPSAPDTAYVVTYTGLSKVGSEADSVLFHMVELDAFGDTVQTDDRSANLPDFGSPVGIIFQASYNMVLAVKPDDPEFVLLGFTNLYRSRDAFKTPANTKSDNWIGGYHTDNNVLFYPGQHPDQHVMAFDPTDPDRLWVGHDGGLSYTTDITVSGAVTWEDKNNNYNVTQFYDVSIPDESGDLRVLGGTQDNGSPIFLANVDQASQVDATGGDGAFSYFGDNYLYASSQEGFVRRFSYNPDGLGGFFSGNLTDVAEIRPETATGQLFINPFAIDPNDEKVIFYPAGELLWRNTDIERTTNFGSFFIDGWEQLTNLSPPAGSIISAVTVSRSNPAHRLYYGAYISDTDPPRIYRIDNAHTAANDGGNLSDISIPGAAGGAGVINIAVNPEDADELIVVMANYNIVGLYHSEDGGATWSAIEGNLEGTTDHNPSLRDAAIIPLAADTLYMVATSTGVYSTKTLNGSGTVWTQEAATTIGNVVAVSIAHRTSDDMLVVGTHGRGIFGKIPQERLLAGDAGWRMMSVPIENMPISDIVDDTPIQGFGDGFDKNFYDGYDGTGFTAPADLSGNLTLGKGFIIYLFDNALAGSSPLPIPIESEGTEPSGNVTVNLHATGDRFNLLGNPYNAPIDFDLLTIDEVENAWWIWDDATSQYWTYNGITGVTETENDGHIAPWQGFFVRAQDGASSPSVTFSPDDKAHYNARFFKNKQREDVRTIRFEVTGGDLSDRNTAAVFYPGGVKGDDPGDMEELTSLSPTFLNLYFENPDDRESLPLANDARPFELSDREEFKLHIESSDPGWYTLRWRMKNIPDDWRIELYDRVTEQILYLRSQDHYRFELQAAGMAKTGRTPESRASVAAQSGDEVAARFELTITKGQAEAVVPRKYTLSQNYPNPFNPVTSIPYELPEAAQVRLEVFNSIGQRVAVLVNEQKTAGFYRTRFDATRLSSGVYFIRLQANDFVQTQSITFIK